MLDNIENLLNSKPYSAEEAAEKEKGPSKIKITPGALTKIKTYARLVERITGSSNECYGFLLSKKDDDSGLVVDAYLADNQTYSSAHVSINGEDVVKGSDAVDPKGYKIVGWWHSHGRLGVFHSGTDRENFETVTHSVGPNTLKTEYEEVKLEDIVRNGKLDLGGYELDASKLEANNIRKKQSYSWAYSLVVNIMGNVYTEVLVKELGAGNKWALNEPKKSAGHEQVAVETDLSIDAKVMEDEVYEKLSVRRYEPVAKIAATKTPAKDARRWGWFGLLDYVAGWFCGNTEREDVVDKIQKEVNKGLDELKEKKKKEYERKQEEEKKAEEAARKSSEEKAAEEAKKTPDEPAKKTEAAKEAPKKSMDYSSIAQQFYDKSKECADSSIPNKFWLVSILASYITGGAATFYAAVSKVNKAKGYNSINLERGKHRKKFTPRFAEELSKSQSLCRLVNDFIEAKDKNIALNALKKYNPSSVPAEKPAAAAKEPAKEEHKEDKTSSGAVKTPVKIIIPSKKNEETDDDPLIALVKADISKSRENAAGLAESFLESFVQYIDSASKEEHRYNDWAHDVWIDYKNGYSGRSESFMRAGRVNVKRLETSHRTYYTTGFNSEYRMEQLVEKATAELLNSQEFKKFAASFIEAKAKDKDGVIETYFKEKSDKKDEDVKRNFWTGYEGFYDYRVCPAAGGASVESAKKTYAKPEPSFEPTASEQKNITEKVYGGIFDSFFRSAKDYLLNQGEYSAWLGHFLMQLAGKEEDDDVKKPIKKVICDKTKQTIENDSVPESIKKRFDWYAEGKPSESEIRDRLFLEFISDFKPEKIPEFHERMQGFARNTMVANAFAKAISDYTMEGWGFNKKPCSRKYCSWAGKVLESIIRPEEFVTIDCAIKDAGELKESLNWSTDYFYTEKDRKMIANQALLDITCFIEPGKQQTLSEFMIGFANAQNSEGKEDPDAVLEKLMKNFGEVKACSKSSQK